MILILGSVLAMQAVVGMPASPADSIEQCATLAKLIGSQSSQLNSNTRMSGSVDCNQRNVTFLFTSTTADRTLMPLLAEIRGALERDYCQEERFVDLQRR